MYLENKAG